MFKSLIKIASRDFGCVINTDGIISCLGYNAKCREHEKYIENYLFHT